MADSQVYLREASVHPAPEADPRVDALLGQMTLEEKVGQMTQITLEVIADKRQRPYMVDRAKLRRAVEDFHVGSVLNVVDEAYTVDEWREITGVVDSLSRASRLGVPVLYGIDAVHGANYTRGAALVPQNIGLAATFNPALVQEAAAVTARDIRAGGLPWDFAPVLDIGRHVAWSRFYETFGEDVHLASVMGVAQVRGLEGDDLASGVRAAATGKHFLGYSGPRTGRDRSSAFITERELREYYVPPFQAAIDAGVATIMINSGDINGVPVHASHDLLTGLLRDEMGFEGVAVTDWEDIKKLATLHRVAENEREATKMAVLAGVDLSMVPNDFSFHTTLVSLVRDGEVPLARIDQAVRRILTLKSRLGLLDAPAATGSTPEAVTAPASRALALQAARESITLLRNRPDASGAPLLPLSPEANVFVTGPAATSMRALNNGWTYTWQGDGRADLYMPEGRTVLDGIRAIAPEATYEPGAGFDGSLDLEAAASGARAADVAVVVLGEESYAEVPGSVTDMWLPDAQLALLDAVAATGTPVVLVLVEGRPRILGEHEAGADALVMAYNPSHEGGQAIAEVLFGRVNPSGRLPFTYPSGPNMLVAYDRTLSDDVDTSYGFTGFQPLARFGDGFGYTTFATSGLTVAPEAEIGEPLAVTVTVQNTGAVAGHEVVLLYVSDTVASVAPATERLARFAKVYLEPGESRTLTFSLDPAALSFVDARGRRLVEPGAFSVRVADQTAEFVLTGDAPLVLSTPAR
ncbi:hypothetical protein BSZ36_11590 [Rubricoccus marinus]|uniref:beta-glucosidase n=1 Tax=Rubricoccus marinus TaxID=716817 RepID=A0A259U4E4_9BACT|nr:hypothetical protein BSZ36_11590 [Rubricoccus marinus]